MIVYEERLVDPSDKKQKVIRRYIIQFVKTGYHQSSGNSSVSDPSSPASASPSISILVSCIDGAGIESLSPPSPLVTVDNSDPAFGESMRALRRCWNIGLDGFKVSPEPASVSSSLSPLSSSVVSCILGSGPDALLSSIFSPSLSSSSGFSSFSSSLSSPSFSSSSSWCV